MWSTLSSSPGLLHQRTASWVAESDSSLFPPVSRSQKFTIKVRAGSHTLCSLYGRSLPGLLLASGACGQFLAFLGLWMPHSNVCHHHPMTASLCVRVCVSLFLL